MNARAVLIALAFLAVPMACSSEDNGATPNAPTDNVDAGGSDDGATPDGASDATPPPPLGEPITAPPSTWTWVDFPEAVCHDGTPTGIGIWPSPASTKLMIYFMGGGACWDYQSCIALGSFAHGPYGEAEFKNQIAGAPGTIVDHGASNPYRDWTTIFVPYCTGDLHAGDLVKTYTDGATSKDIHHKGRANVAAYLARIGATFPTATDVIITGSSAGGGGSIFSYDRARQYWPKATMFLIDDALPLFVKDDMHAQQRHDIFDNWNLPPLTTPICGANCVDDMSLMFNGLATKYPNDRMALLSSLRDSVISGAYGLTQEQFQTALGTFTKDVLDPTGHFKHFYVTGQAHPLLLSYATFKSKTVNLRDWLPTMTSGDPAWESADP